LFRRSTKQQPQASWSELADKDKEDSEFLIIDIPADLIVTTIKRKLYRNFRIERGIRRVREGFFVFRPFFCADQNC
jgi:hypothetical protein